MSSLSEIPFVELNDVSDEIMKRFRADPVAFIREVYPDTQLSKYQLEAIRMMSRDPRTKLQKAKDGYYFVLPTDITREMEEALFSGEAVGSWDADHKSASKIVEDIAAARYKMFEGREMTPFDEIDLDDINSRKVDTSRQVFKNIANRMRRRRRK